MNMTTGPFINPIPSTANAYSSGLTKSKRRNTTAKNKTLDYDPIILPQKKRASRQFRISKSRARYDSQNPNAEKEIDMNEV